MQVSLGLGSTYIARHEERKSMSTERTFRELNKAEEQLSLCRELCEDLAEDMKKEDLKGKTVTLKLKSVNFEVKTRAVTLPYAVATVDEIYAAAKDLLKTEIENESPQPLRLRLMGVRISAFISSDDKKPLQKSIIGFLQPGKTDSTSSNQLEREHLSSCPPLVQKCQRQEEIPWRTKLWGIKEGQTSDEPQMSFFQKAHAKRLQLQAVSASTQEEVHEEKASVITSTGNHVHESVKSSINGQRSESNCEVSGLSENDSVSLSDAHATTSGLGGRVSESLTCPVCFRQVETTDLNVFNQHIDQCLSDVSRKPNQITVSDSESDQNGDNDHEECEVIDKWRRESEAQNKQESNKPDSLQDQHNLKNDSSQTVSLINGENGPVTLEQPQPCNGKGPVLICPVCQLTQDTNDLTMFNRHVDLCLNQEVLHELGGQTSSSINLPSVTVTNTKVTDKGHLLLRQTSKAKTKRRDTPSSPPSKKARGPGPRNTIDKFLR